MTQSKHTPGPWRVLYTDNGPVIRIDESARETSGNRYLPLRDVAIVSPIMEKCEPGERDANARLIAAAPELLEALEVVLKINIKGHSLQDRLPFSSEGREILAQCLNVIKKAKGMNTDPILDHISNKARGQ